MGGIGFDRRALRCAIHFVSSANFDRTSITVGAKRRPPRRTPYKLSANQTGGFRNSLNAPPRLARTLLASNDSSLSPFWNTDNSAARPQAQAPIRAES